MTLRRLLALTLGILLCVASGADAGSKISMLDNLGVAQGVAAVSLEKGAVNLKVILEPLPATVDTGTEIFEASLYKAYLVNSLDPAVEVCLGDVWPSAKGVAKLKVKTKGDMSQLGLDRVVVVAYSKDGLHSYDVLTGTLESQ